MASEDSMLHWLGEVCREARKDDHRIASEIAAAALVDQATISRFEKQMAWPRKAGGADRIVAAYAKVTGIDSFELWRRALDRWAASLHSENGMRHRKGGAR